MAWLLAIPAATFGIVMAAAQLASSADAAPARAPTTPPGNNGTVKVDGVPFDDLPDNEPHVGCVFQIDFYGYDQGDLYATYAFDLWAPTGSGTLATGDVFIGEDAAGGGRDLDASVTVDLSSAIAASGAQPQPQQGYHVRLTVHAEGSIGADVKYKMFWVECGPVSTSTTPPPSSSTPPVSSSTPPVSSSTPPVSSSTPPVSSSTPPATVSGTTVTTTPPRSSTPPPTSHGSTSPPSVAGKTFTPPGGRGPSSSGLAFTGSETVWAALVALGLLLAGTGSLWLSRRLGRSD